MSERTDVACEACDPSVLSSAAAASMAEVAIPPSANAATALDWSVASAADHPRAAPSLSSLLAQTLDEVDYGVLVLDDGLRIVYANHLARTDLRGSHPLQLHGQELRVRQAVDLHTLEDALRAALRRGIRRLISLGEGAERVSVSVVPLAVDGQRAPALMLALGKRQLCANLSVQGFSRIYRLSPGEEHVLAALCSGMRPADVARMNGVALSTVRTQIANIRTKTGADSIRTLVQNVSMLPPLVGALRHSATAAPVPSRTLWG